jgi:hypothetical protein
MLDFSIQFLISKEDEIEDALIKKFDKNLERYGTQDFTVGMYIKMLFFTLKCDYFETNLRLAIYRKLIEVLRKNGLVYKIIEPPMPGASYPYYYGSGLPALTPIQIQALTTDPGIKANRIYTYALTEEVYYVAYPRYYGTLRSILDMNGFETINGWTLREENFDILGVIVPYYIYEFSHITTQASFTNTFKY